MFIITELFNNPFNSALNTGNNSITEFRQFQKQSEKPKGRFAQLDEYVKGLTPHQQKFISEQPQVQELSSNLITVFTSTFLFELLKYQFEEWCDKNGLQGLINEYVDTCLNVTKNYIDPDKKIELLEKELKELKNQKDGEKL